MTQARGARYRHTNLIARDWKRLAAFYEEVFGCTRVPPERDLQGKWLENGTRVPRAHLRGVHLRLPGFDADGPTLEIFGYDEVVVQEEPIANRTGFAHIAFAVDDVLQALEAFVAAGGSRFGDVVTHEVEGAGELCFTYARDPEGNLVELQAWRTSQTTRG